jgi:hypothetical protein
MIDVNDIKIEIDTTWLESTESEFHRVVVLTITTDPDLFSRENTIEKLERDIGLKVDIDYMFCHDMFHAGDNFYSSTIRLRDEEQFVMLQLYYYG